MAVQVTDKEYKFESKMATEAGLLELGKQMVLESQEKEMKEKNKEKLANYLSSVNVNKKNKLVKAFVKYMEYTQIDIEELTKVNKNLKESINDLDEQSDDYIIEIEELSTEVDSLKIKIKQLTEKINDSNIKIKYERKKVKYLTIGLSHLISIFIIITANYFNYIIL